jgi:DNA-binding MarR family transcriptional regulator
MERLDLIGLITALQQLERNSTVALMYSGLRIPQFRLLVMLERCGDATVTEVSRRLHITRASASVLVNELIRSAIVVVEENPADRRSFHIQLSDLGRKKLQVARSDLAVLQGELTRNLPAGMVASLNEFANQLTRERGDG